MNLTKDIAELENALFKIEESNKIRPIVNNVRGIEHLPRLIIKPQGKFIYLENYQNLLNYVNRDKTLFSKYLANKLGCQVDITDKELRIKGEVKITKIKEAEKLFYKKEVECFYCRCPDTIRTPDGYITCTNCQKSRKA